MWSCTRIFLLLQLFLINVHCVRKVKLGGKDCTFKVRDDVYIFSIVRRMENNNWVEGKLVITQGEKICNGAVTKEIGSTTLQICVNGKVIMHPSLPSHLSLSR